jgi:hypothetical protein
MATTEPYSQDAGDTTCPICLSLPTAPRMTKCGHVCLVHMFPVYPTHLSYLDLLFPLYLALLKHLSQQMGPLSNLFRFRE